MLAGEVSRGRNPLVAASGSRLPEFLDIGTGPKGIVLAGVLVRTSDTTATQGGIVVIGGTVGVTAGSVVTAKVPTGSLALLAERAEVFSVEASHMNRSALNVSRVEVGADLVNAGTSLGAPYTGRGVVVGVADTGIDYRHPDFNTSAGTRLLGIWDISGLASTSPLSAARTCATASINAGTCSEVDVDGHGTHVSGIAAGNGRALAGYAGMAPEADILFAKATRSTSAGPSFADADVIAACQWVFDQAQSFGEPAVVNLSLVSQYGPHDGTTNYETGLAALEGPGRIIVVAAGNDGPAGGGHLIHVGYATSGVDFNSGLETEWQFNDLPSSLGIAREEAIDIWYPSGSIYFGVAVRDSTGAVIGGWVGVGPGSSVSDKLMTTSSGQSLGYVSIDATVTADPNNGSRHVVVDLNNGNGTVDMRGYTYSLVTWGSGAFDGWLFTSGNATTSQFSTASSTRWRPGDAARTVAIPGTGKRVITVGAYTTKTQWIDFDGTVQRQTSCGAVGDLYCFSSFGPTRDGRLKPDLTAPGQVIVAPFSSAASGNHQPSEVLQGGYYLKDQGTSMASPHVAGIVALMLQASPTLTPELVLAALQQSTRTDSFTGPTPNFSWGAGKVSAVGAIKAVTGGAAPTAPVANFTFSPSRPGPGQLVVFTDLSTGVTGLVTSWVWEFGDGGFSSSENPSYSYTSVGTYSVNLTVLNSAGRSSITKTLQVGAAPALSHTYVLPSSAHSVGANGAFYTTDLSISNRGTTTANLSIQFVSHDQNGTGGPQQPAALLPGASITYADVLGSLFGVTSGYGGISITSDSGSLKIVGETSTPPPNGQGTLGQSVPGLTSGSLVTPSTSQSLIALRQDAGFRTNAVLMNVSNAAAHVVLQLFGSDASLLGSSTVDLAPFAMTQISGVVTALGAPYGTSGAVLVVSTTTPGAQIACYASVIDNVTNDPRTILP